ncbi:MAG TPA: BON domain-containing protein [Steroidobacteraceae bacterium]|nr:BON domain-containing protein [Steroidobacteraceae bacterium]
MAATLLLVLGAAGACTGARELATPTQASAASQAGLAARVKAALHADPNFNDAHIDVFIENGDVVLSGFVEDNRALLDALEMAQRVAGSRKVIDNLSIMKISAH